MRKHQSGKPIFLEKKTTKCDACAEKIGSRETCLSMGTGSAFKRVKRRSNFRARLVLSETAKKQQANYNERNTARGTQRQQNRESNEEHGTMRNSYNEYMKKTPHITQQRARVTLRTQVGAQRHQK